MRLNENVLKQTDFEEGGMFEGVPSEQAQKLMEFVNSSTLERQRIVDATIEGAIELARKAPEYSNNVVKDLSLQAAKKVLEKTKLEIDENGQRRFRDGQGATILDTDYNPASFSHILSHELVKFLPNGQGMQQNNGTGQQRRQSGDDLPDVSGCKNKVEADKIIEQHLKDRKITVFHPKFNAEFQRIREATGTNDLPTYN